VSKDRHPASQNNPLLVWQELFSNQVQDALNGYRDLRDAAQEMCFYGVYGVLNSLTGNAPGRNLQEHAEQHDKVLIERLQDALPLGGLMEALIRILFLLGRDSDEPGKESVEKLILQLQVLLQDYSAEPLDLRETLRLQKLLVATHPQESLHSLPLMLVEVEERQQVLAAVANLLPELLTSGADNPFWCELHTLLDVPLPGFSLTQPPGEADAIEEKAPVVIPEPIKQKTPAVTPEPIKQITPVEIPEPIKQQAPRVIPEPIKQKIPAVTPDPIAKVASPVRKPAKGKKGVKKPPAP
jgi:hypothetical protein